MAKCVNCGRHIAPDAENQLCPRCVRCTNLYEAQVRRLKVNTLRALCSGIFVACIAAVIHLCATGRIASLVGTLLFYYAAASVLFPSAANLSSYLQLRQAVKKELSQKK